MFLCLKIFEMMDAKARQDCIKEIDLLKVRIFIITFSFCSFFGGVVFICLFCLWKKIRLANKSGTVKEKAVLPEHVMNACV